MCEEVPNDRLAARLAGEARDERVERVGALHQQRDDKLEEVAARLLHVPDDQPGVDLGEQVGRRDKENVVLLDERDDLDGVDEICQRG